MTYSPINKTVQEEGRPAEGTTTTRHTLALTYTKQLITMTQEESAVQQAVQGKRQANVRKTPSSNARDQYEVAKAQRTPQRLPRHANPRRTRL